METPLSQENVLTLSSCCQCVSNVVSAARHISHSFDEREKEKEEEARDVRRVAKVDSNAFYAAHKRFGSLFRLQVLAPQALQKKIRKSRRALQGHVRRKRAFSGDECKST